MPRRASRAVRLLQPADLDRRHQGSSTQAGRRERRLGSAADRGGDPLQSGWWPTTTTTAAPVGDRGTQPLAFAPGASRSSACACALECMGELGAAVSRARRSGLVRIAAGRTPSAREAPAEVARGGQAGRRQRAQVVGLTRGGSGMADEVHGARSQTYERMGRLGAKRDSLRCDERPYAWPTRVAAWRASVTSSATSSPRRRWTGNQLAVFTDARDLPEERCSGPAREMNFSETVFVYPSGTAPRTDPDLHSVEPSCLSPGIRLWGRHSSWPGRCRSTRSPSRRAEGVVPVRLEREGAQIVFGRMEQPIPTIERYDDEAALFAALGVERSELPVELYDNGLPNVYVDARLRPRTSPRSSPISRASSSYRPCPRELHRRVRCGGGRRACSLQPTESRRIPRPDRRRGRSRSISRDTAGSRSATRSRSRRVSRSTGRRSCSPASTAAPSEVERVEVGGSAVVVARGEFQL